MFDPLGYLDTFLFGYYPYICGTVFLLGSLVRFDRDQYTWKAHSSQLLRNKNMRLASNLFHVGILLLFFGHFFGLLTPPKYYHYFGLTPPSKQVLAIVAGAIFGLMTFVGLTILLHRRLTDPRVRANSTRMDIFILLLLYVQLIMGLITIFVSLHHLDGVNMMLLHEWSRRILTFQSGAIESLVGISWWYKLHLFLGLTTFLIFPFTRLVHVWSAPVWYLGRRYQVVRQR
jgi:nitrate reductase gamma subunit